MQDQEARSRGVVQPRPGDLDLFQFAQRLTLEVADGHSVAGFVRVRSELAVQEPPREPFGSAEGKGPVNQPEVDLVAWIIPKDALSSCFSTPGIT